MLYMSKNDLNKNLKILWETALNFNKQEFEKLFTNVFRKEKSSKISNKFGILTKKITDYPAVILFYRIYLLTFFLLKIVCFKLKISGWKISSMKLTVVFIIPKNTSRSFQIISDHRFTWTIVFLIIECILILILCGI